MTQEPQALKTGRQRYQKKAKVRRRREAQKRVAAYQRWLKRGSPMREIPPIPSSADFKIARGQRG